MSEFVEFRKIPRFNREVIVTEKIDGTNASILVGENGEFLAGSRTRWITPQADNFGFSTWAYKNRDALTAMLGVGHHFGEWWGVGIQRGYDISERRWSLFNVSRWSQGCGDQFGLPNVSSVPVLARGFFRDSVVETAMADLALNGSRASPGFQKPEGVIVYHVAGNLYFKATLEKDDEPKSRA
jgi:hypothetical protein